jgi:hypothetical protein
MCVITIGLQIKNPYGVLISCNPAGVRFLFKYRVIYKQGIPPGFIYVLQSRRDCLFVAIPIPNHIPSPVGVAYKQRTPNGVHEWA